MHYFLFLLGFVILDKKDSIYCVTIFVKNYSVVQLSICVLTLVDDALHRLQIGQEIEKTLGFDTLVTIYIQKIPQVNENVFLSIHYLGWVKILGETNAEQHISEELEIKVLRYSKLFAKPPNIWIWHFLYGIKICVARRESIYRLIEFSLEFLT